MKSFVAISFDTSFLCPMSVCILLAWSGAQRASSDGRSGCGLDLVTFALFGCLGD